MKPSRILAYASSGLPLLAVALACALSGYASAQPFSIVSPLELANVAGDESVIDLGLAPPLGFRAQYTYAASDFSGLPAGYHSIVSMAWRPDERFTNPRSSTLNFELRLSTTDVEPGGLSSVFAENIGPDETIVYSGALTLETSGRTGDGPSPFDYLIEFDERFEYDPDLGNLLVDFKLLQPATGSTPLGLDSQATDLDQSPGTTDASSPVATVGFSNEIIPAQFTFVPEPTSLAIAALGFMLCLSVARPGREIRFLS